MRLLLDENFPLQLYRHLVGRGHHVEHIIVLGQRGIADSEIAARLSREPGLVFVTQDHEFADVLPKEGGSVIISLVSQSLPVQAFLAAPPTGRLFELLDTGEIVGWEIHEA